MPVLRSVAPYEQEEITGKRKEILREQSQKNPTFAECAKMSASRPRCGREKPNQAANETAFRGGLIGAKHLRRQEILGRRRMPWGKRGVVAILLACHAGIAPLWRRPLAHLHLALTLGFHVFLLNRISAWSCRVLQGR
jgi:hypothetical protein